MRIGERMITDILQHVLFEYASDELTELALDLQISGEPLAAFCDRFELGNWFYDQMTLADTDIISEVMVLASEHRKAEIEDLNEDRMNRDE